jgi:hypothetical protein
MMQIKSKEQIYSLVAQEGFILWIVVLTDNAMTNCLNT